MKYCDWNEGWQGTKCCLSLISSRWVAAVIVFLVVLSWWGLSVSSLLAALTGVVIFLLVGGSSCSHPCWWCWQLQVWSWSSSSAALAAAAVVVVRGIPCTMWVPTLAFQSSLRASGFLAHSSSLGSPTGTCSFSSLSGSGSLAPDLSYLCRSVLIYVDRIRSVVISDVSTYVRSI